MAEVIIGITVKGESRYEEIRSQLFDTGWDYVRGPRGLEKALYLNSSALNTVAQVVSYFKNLSDEAGKPMLHSGDKVSIRVIGSQGGKAHYVVP